MGGINPKKQIYLTLFFCVLLTNGIYAGACGKGCTRPDGGKLKYQAGSVYEYQFDSLVSIGVSQAAEKKLDETAVQVQGLAKLFANGDCGYQVQLSNFIVKTQRNGAPGQVQKQFNNADLAEPVNFLMSNGELEAQLCQNSNQKQSDHVLNIKRAIVSMFQSSESEHETDIFGYCPVQRTEVGNTITTHRDLNDCTYREKFVNGFIQSIINLKAGIKSHVYLQGDAVKTQKLSAAGIFENVELVEEYKFLPYQHLNKNSLSDPKAPAESNFEEKYVGLAKVKTTLKLSKTSAGRSTPIAAGKQVSVIYDYVSAKPVKNLQQLSKSLDKTVSLVQRHTQFQSAKYFTEIIRLMRQSDAATLIELSNIANSPMPRKVYLDALFRAGTSESVKALAKLIPKMNEQEKRMAFLSFMVVNNPVDKDALKEASALLTSQPITESYLSIGNLLNLHCDKNECDSTSNIFVSISQKFVDALKHCKFPVGNKKEETRIVGVLKGIRNSKKLADPSAQKLVECVEPDRSARVRVAAIQAFSASNCNAVFRQKLLEILKNRNEDSEIRIEAYLGLVSCPTRELATELAELLQTEEVNQVGTFLTTHLKSIRDSTDFTRESQRYYLGNIRLPVKFPVDPRKFSFNSELSYSLGSLGLGASSDVSVIYSQTGFLPRSLRLNVTTEVFGKSFNFIELGARQENLEDILEYYFGPKGYFNKDPQAVVDELDTLTRSKRAAADTPNKMFKSYKTFGSDKFHNDINFDLSLKLFGTEFGFLSIGDVIPTDTKELIQLFGRLSEKTKLGLKNYQKQFEYHGTLEDFGLRYPTGSGFPLELTEQTILVGKIDFGTEIDIDRNLADPTSAKYRVKLIPSADLYSSFQARIDAGFLQAGVMVDANINTATGGDYKLEILHNPQGFHFDVDFPRNEIDIIELKYDVNFFVAEQDKEMILQPLFVNQKRSKSETKLEKCFEQLGEALGVQLCYVAHMPEQENADDDCPYLSPMHLGVKLKTERKVKFSGLYQHHANLQTWSWIYDTPESQVPHKTELKLELGTGQKLYTRLSLDNPKLRHSMEAGMQTDQREFVVYFQTEGNSEKQISKIGFTKSQDGKEYRPLIHVQDKDGVKNDIFGYKADGRVLVDSKDTGAKYNFDNFRLIRPNNQQTLFNGWIELTRTKMTAQISVQEQQNRYKILADLGANEQKEYTIGGYLIDESKKDDNQFGGTLVFQYHDSLFKSDLQLQAGLQKFHLSNDFRIDEQLNSKKFQNTVELKHDRDVVLSGKLNGVLAEKSYEIDFEAQRNDKRLAVLYKFGHSQKTPAASSNYLVDYNLELNVKLNRHYLDLKSHSDLKPNQKYHLDTNLVTSWGTRANLKGDVQNIEPVQVNLNGNFQISKTDPECNFVVKMTNAQNKQKFEFSFARNKVNLIQTTVDVQRATDKPVSGKIVLQLKDNLNANGNFKFNSKNGRGDFNVVINLLKKSPDQQKVQLDSKFLILSPKYDLDTTLQFDGNRKIHLKTENIYDCGDSKPAAKQAPEQKTVTFSTKNLFELNQEKTQFNMQYQLNGADFKYDSDLDMKFDLQLPTGRKFTGNGKRKMNAKQHKGDINFYLDEVKPSQEKRSVQVTGTLTDFNKKYTYFNVNYNLVYTNFNGKQIEVQIGGKNTPKSGSIDAEADLTTGLILFKVGGSEFNVPKFIDVNIVLNEIGQNHVVYTVTGKYLQNYALNFNGNAHSGESEKEPVSFDVNGDLTMGSPNEKYTMKSNGKLRVPTDSDDKYEILFNLENKYPQSSQLKDLSVNLLWNGDENSANYKLLWTCPWKGKMSIDGNYRFIEDEQRGLDGLATKLNYNLGQYGQAQQEFSIETVKKNTINLKYKLRSSYEALREVEYDGKYDIIDNNDANDRLTVDSNLVLNGKKYTLNSIVFAADEKLGIDMKIDYPTYKTVVLATYEEVPNSNKIVLNLNLQNLLHENDFDLSGRTDISYDASKKNVVINGNLNSIKFKLNKIQYDLKIVQGDTNSVDFHITKNAGKENILRGQTQFRATKNANDIQFQGSGNVLYFNEEMNANFKLTQQEFANDPHGEKGWSYQFNGKFGPKNLVSTIKLTNKDFHIKFATCEESKQCTNFEIHSLLRNAAQPQTGPQLQQHEIMVLIDLRELKFPYEFELQIKTTAPAAKNMESMFQSGTFPYVGYWQNIAQEIEMNINSNSNHKYKMVINLRPQKCTWELKLPKREIVLEYDEKLPDFKYVGETGFNGEYEQKLTFYFDKLNNPKEKTQFTMLGEVSAQQIGLAHSRFQMKFEHPTIRAVSITGTAEFNRQKQFAQSQIEFDIFKREDQKVVGIAKAFGDSNLSHGNYDYTAEAKWMSQGLNFAYLAQAKSGLKLEPFVFTAQTLAEDQGNPNLKFGTNVLVKRDSFNVGLTGMNQKLVQIDGTMNLNDRKLSVKGHAQLSEQLKARKIMFSGELEMNGGKFELKRADNQFIADCDLRLAKEFRCTAKNSQKNLVNVNINLGLSNFLETKFDVKQEDLSQFMQTCEREFKQDSDVALNELKTKFEQTKQHFTNQMQQVRANLIDIKKLQSNSEQNLNGIVKELEDDPALKEIFDTYRKIYDSLTKLTQKLIETYKKFYEQMLQIWEDFYNSISGLINERIMPELKKFVEIVKTNLIEAGREASKTLTELLEYALKATKELEASLQEILKPIAEVLKPFEDIFMEIKKSVEKELSEIWKEFEDLYKKLPELINQKYEELRAKLKDLVQIEEISKILKEIFAYLEDMPVPPDVKEFLKKLSQYLELRLRGNDDEKLFNDLIQSFMNSLGEIYEAIANGFKVGSASSYLGFILSAEPLGLPYSANLIDQFPAILTTMDFSPLNYIQNENAKQIAAALSSGYNGPTDLLPPYELKAHLAGGHHFFTFDNRHFTFPAQKQCKYILAQDSIDNNFTVVANYNGNSKIQSIQLFDRMSTKNMELFANGQLKLNGQPVEYPVHEGDLHSWRRYYTVTMLSEYGVEIKCTTDLSVCHLVVNGFYTSKLRGLFGNANSEQYDDFIQPNGQIEKNYAEFGNKYALGNCQPVQFDQKLDTHHHGHGAEGHGQAPASSDICTEIFSYSSSNFALAYLFVDSRLYREACQHAISVERDENTKLEAACNIALAYASVSRLENLPVQMPDMCLKCGTNEIGSTQEYKIPATSADVVVVFDTQVDAQVQKELIQPVLQDLRVQLKQRGFQDIELAVIAYDEDQMYPALITSGQGKLNYNGNINDIKLKGPKQFDSLFSDLKNNKLNEWLAKLKLASSKLHGSEMEAYALAFDYPFRSQAAKSIISIRSYHSGNDLLNQLAATISDLYLSTNGIQLHIIAPTEISLEGVPSEKIVGFNKRAVATIDGGKDQKKREKLKYNEFSSIDSGWVFALQNFQKLKSPDQKTKFVHQVTTGIADQMYKTEIALECYCSIEYGLHAQDSCHVVSSQFVQTKKATAPKG